MEKKYLTEENYEKGKRTLKIIALCILIVGFLVGGGLIATGVMKQNKINSKYSDESKAKISEQLDAEKQNLISNKDQLEKKIAPIQDQIKKLEREPFNGFDDAYYAREDKIEELKKSIATDKKSIDVISGVLEDADFACEFDGKTNMYTSKYCSLSNELSDISSEFDKKFDSHKNIPFYMFGAFIIVASLMGAGFVFFISKGREIAAFTTQQAMPIAQEGIDAMAPTVGNAAKEIAKGIKEGMKDDEQK